MSKRSFILKGLGIDKIYMKNLQIFQSYQISLVHRIYFFLRSLMLPLSQIDLALPKEGVILDLGCGIGSLSVFLATLSRKRKVVGWDIDVSRIGSAKKITKNLANIKFEVKNALGISTMKNLSGIVVSDVLHHINSSQQEVLVRSISMALSKSGILVIKEVDKDQKLRALFSLLWDRLFYPNDISYFRSRKEWIKILSENKYYVKTQQSAKWFPGSTTLFICTRQHV